MSMEDIRKECIQQSERKYKGKFTEKSGIFTEDDTDKSSLKEGKIDHTHGLKRR